MRFYPTKIQGAFTCFFLFSILLNLGCSKDSDLLLDSVINDSVSTVEEKEKDTSQETEASTEEETTTKETPTDETQEPSLESRTSSFSPINDAHFQSGKGYNQNIIRLDEGNRTSFLMFDLGPIEVLNGAITEATLQFTIESDNGSGNIEVFKANSNDWSEENLSADNIPQTGVQLGSILKEYKMGETEFIDLNALEINAEVSSLVLSHKNGNGLAFASKEHPSKIGSELVVTYSVAPGTEEITIVEESPTQEEPPPQDENPSEDQEEASANQEPIAVSDASPSSGGAPLEVVFTGSNSSDDKKITSYLWDFKNGATSTQANPIHTFTNVGTYQVLLTVTDAEGLSSTDNVTITVNQELNEAPVAKVSATPILGEAPLEVSFEGSSSTDDNSITKYEWDFKDGQESNTADVVHTYTEPGVYTAVLTVTDENGLTDKSSITITVEEAENEAPVARTSANSTLGEAPLAVQFTGTNSTDDMEITSYSWDFKDGSKATTANPSHTFESAGTYVVELTVSDVEGLTHKNTITIRVTQPAVENEGPVAHATANKTSGDAPLAVQFTGNNSTDDKAISSYFWDFKDGSTSSSANPSHTFNQAGSYVVILTVTDAEGESDAASITINVNEPVSTNNPPGFYVATNGSANNNGSSPSSPWSLEHAFYVANPGDVIYVKAGNYGKKEIITRNSGNSGNLIKFIGYRNTPGDIQSTGGSTFKYGESVNAGKMPLLSSSNGTGIAFTLHHRYVHLENFQIDNFSIGIQSIGVATNVVLKNVIVTNSGRQNSSSAYDGHGITIRGNNTSLENCFVLNAVAHGITMSDSDYSSIKNCGVYADNASNPTDYYFFLAGGTNNTVVENCHAERGNNLRHGGHGFNIKNDGSYNTFKNCTAIRTNFELTYSGVHHNTIDGGAIYGIDKSAGNWHARMSIIGGAHDNTIKNLLIQDTWTAIALITYNDRTGVDASMGNDNIFENVTVKNTDRVLNIGGGTNYGAITKRNRFRNCNFSDFNIVAVTYYRSEDFRFEYCTFKNGEQLVGEAGGAYSAYSKFDVDWINCTWQNVDFTPPN